VKKREKKKTYHIKEDGGDTSNGKVCSVIETVDGEFEDGGNEIVDPVGAIHENDFDDLTARDDGRVGGGALVVGGKVGE